MSKPVKLEVLIEDKTGKGIDSTKKSVADMTANFKRDIETQKSIVKDLERYIKDLERQIGRLSDDNAKKELIPSMFEAERELVSAKEALSQLENELKQSGSGSVSLRTQIRNLREEMAMMTEGTDEYRAAMMRLGDLMDKVGDINQQGRVFGDDEKNIRATADAIAGLSGAMSAGVGIASLFGTEQEKLAQIQTRLQAVMATTIGIQQVAQTLNKDSYFSILVLQGAKKKWASAQALLNTQLGIGVGLSKALMVSGIGLLLAGIAALAVQYDKWRKKQAEVNALKQEYIDIEVDTAKAMANEKIKLEQLHKIAGDHTKTLDVRNKAIEKLKSIMPEYNGYIDKEGALVDNATESLKRYIDMLYKVEKAKTVMSRMEEIDAKIKEAEETPAKSATLWQKSQSAFIAATDASGTLTYKGLIDDIEAKNEAVKEKAIEGLREQKKALDGELDGIVSDTSILERLFGNEKPGSSSVDKSLPENRLAEMRLSALRNIREQEIALMQEGEEKRKAQAQLALENRINEITKEKQEREKHLLEITRAGIPVSEQEVAVINEQAQMQALNAKKLYDEQIKAIDEETARNFEAIQNELRLDFATRLQQQIADADAYYNRLKEKAQGNATILQQIEENRLRAIKEITHEAQLRELEIDNDLALRREQISQRYVLLETDRQKQLLTIEMAGAQARLAKLEEMQRDGMETSEDIKAAKLEVERLEKALKKLPVDRVREIGKHLKGWMQTIGNGIGGELGDVLNSLAGGVDSVMSSLDKDATKFDHIGNAISGLTKLYSLASDQLEENKRRQGEWNDKMEEAAHKARMMRIEQLEYQESNVFGVENPYKKAIDGANQYSQAMKELNASIGSLAAGQIQTGTKKVVSGKNVASGAAAGAGAGAALGSIIPGIGTAIGAGIGALIGGIFGGSQKKVVPVFESLTKKFGSILKTGTETFELNPAIIENYSKLDEATKKLVDNWEEIRQKALESQEQMRQTFKDLAGDIGGALSDALVNSFKNGDVFGAIDVFQDKINNTIEAILGQLIFARHFQDMFDDLEKRFEASFDVGGDNDIVDDIVWFSQEYKKQIEAYAKNMEAARDEFKNQGIDIFQPTAQDRQGVAKGISGLTQDQGNKLEGQLTHVTGKLMSIEKNVIDMSVNLFRIFAPISRIADNTDRLEAIEDGIRSMEENIDKAIREGLYMKR